LKNETILGYITINKKIIYRNMKWKNIFDKFSNNKILIIGDVMMDTYLIGKVERISPEAPVPIVDIEKRINKLGGAANVALNIKALGATPIVCSVLGKDERGFDLEALFKENGLNTNHLFKVKNRKTTNKIRVIGNQSQMLRIDEETRCDIKNGIFDKLKENIIVAVAENHFDGIIFQDYDKGVITDEMIEYIIKLSKKRNIPLFIDPKIKNFEYYEYANIFKPNFNELKRGLKEENLDIENWSEIKPFIDKLMEKREIESFYTTMGSRGILLSYKDGNKILHEHIEGQKRSVSDVSGAGDTVISVASLLTINKVNKIETAKIANIAGGIVCEKVGVVPINKEELLSEINF
jgi:D-glycero-beta-D-manno-heptose-7-phosphate kinase